MKYLIIITLILICFTSLITINYVSAQCAYDPSNTLVPCDGSNASLIIEPRKDKLENIDGKLFRIIGPFTLESEFNNTIRLDDVKFTLSFYPNTLLTKGYVLITITFDDGLEEKISKIGTSFPFVEFTEHVDPKAGVIRNANGTFNFLLSVEQQSLSPLKQIQSGIALIDVKCNDNKIPVYKHNRIRAACVTEDTKNTLFQRGWILVKNEQSTSSFSVISDKKNVADGPRLNIITEIIDGRKYLVFHGYGWHILHNVEITIKNGDEKITTIRSKTNENGVLYMPWSLPDNLSSDLYTIFATDGVNQSESTISIPMYVIDQSRYGSSELEVGVTGEKQVRRGTTHIIEIQVNKDRIPVNDAQVFISIEDYGGDIIREFQGRTNQQGSFVFSWEIPKKFDDIKTLLAFVDVTDGISSKTDLFKFYVYCLPGEKNCKVKGN